MSHGSRAQATHSPAAGLAKLGLLIGGEDRIKSRIGFVPDGGDLRSGRANGGGERVDGGGRVAFDGSRQGFGRLPQAGFKRRESRLRIRKDTGRLSGLLARQPE